MSVLVLGIGNLVMQDDGIGVRLIKRLEEKYLFPPGVTLLDGGTLGLDLLPWLKGVERLLIVDALDLGVAPGTLKRLQGEEISTALMTKVSPHQVGLQDLLGVAALMGISFRETLLLGMQPAAIGLGLQMSPAVEAGMGKLEAAVIAQLCSWGIDPHGNGKGW